MAHPIGIRPATSEDKEQLFQLYALVFRTHIEAIWGWDDEWQQEQFERDYESTQTSVVLVGGVVRGYIQVTEGASRTYLNNIGLHPEVQGEGIGSRLVKQLMKEAAGRGDRVDLKVFRTNPRAQAFYEALGFQNVGKTESHIEMSWATV